MSRTPYAGDWINARLPRSGPRSCPVCHNDWCQIGVGENAGTVLCKRVYSSRSFCNEGGSVCYIHHLDGTERDRFRVMQPDPPPGVRASDPLLNEAYKIVLSEYPLIDFHRTALHRRGLDDDAIKSLGYGSLTFQGREDVANDIARAIGKDAALTIPGVRLRGGRLTLGGAPGLIVPMRDTRGSVFSLLTRPDTPKEPKKTDGTTKSKSNYFAVSSSKYNGASARNGLHVPLLPVRSDRTDIVVVEGVLKSDVAQHLSGLRCVGVHGTGMWRSALPAVSNYVKRHGRMTRVCVAFDMDFESNVQVANALAACLREFRSNFSNVVLLKWDRAHKGFDDHLLAQRIASQAKECA